MDDNPSQKAADLLKQISENPPPEESAKQSGKEEEIALKDRIEADKEREVIRGLRQDIDERKTYANKSFKLVCRWVSGVFVILLFQGFFSDGSFWEWDSYHLSLSFKLPDSVLLAVVGGTTVSIIGIFLVVANYLFPKR